MPDDVYRERAELVAFLARIYGAYVWENPAEPDWPIVYIGTPAGQLSWHLAKTDMDLFENFPKANNNMWDGHSTSEKYDRLRSLGGNHRDVIANVFENGFRKSRDGASYDYADEIEYELYRAGWAIMPVAGRDGL
jgi:hypothetical protein